MKTTIVAIFALFVIGGCATNGSTMVEKRVKTFEMPESGQTISFPITEEEITKKDAKIARREKLGHKAAKKQNQQFERFEMPESGNYIFFPVK